MNFSYIEHVEEGGSYDTFSITETGGAHNTTAVSHGCSEIVETLRNVDVMPGGSSSSVIHEAVGDMSTPLGVVLAVGTFFASLTLLVVGHRILRSATAITASSVVFFVVLSTTDSWIHSCEAQLGAAAVSSLCVGILVICMLKAGLFIVGGVSFGLTSYIFYDGIVTSEPNIAGLAWGGRSVLMWAIVAASAVAGSFVVHFMRSRVYMAVSSALGGAGMCVFTVLVAPSVPPWGVVAIFMASIGFGCGVQYTLQTKTRREQAMKVLCAPCGRRDPGQRAAEAGAPVVAIRSRT